MTEESLQKAIDLNYSIKDLQRKITDLTDKVTAFTAVNRHGYSCFTVKDLPNNNLNDEIIEYLLKKYKLHLKKLEKEFQKLK